MKRREGGDVGRVGRTNPDEGDFEPEVSVVVDGAEGAMVLHLQDATTLEEKVGVDVATKNTPEKLAAGQFEMTIEIPLDRPEGSRSLGYSLGTSALESLFGKKPPTMPRDYTPPVLPESVGSYVFREIERRYVLAYSRYAEVEFFLRASAEYAQAFHGSPREVREAAEVFTSVDVTRFPMLMAVRCRPDYIRGDWVRVEGDAILVEVITAVVDRDEPTNAVVVTFSESFPMAFAERGKEFTLEWIRNLLRRVVLHELDECLFY